MRSRYSAYALNLPEYIIQTTHPASPHYLSETASWKRDLSNFSLQSRFQQLIIHDHKENEPFAVVSFTAFISQEDRDTTFTETSYFEKINERWFYRFGHLTEGHSPNLITTEQLKLLPLAYYGDSILRRKGEPIVEITSELRKLVDEMIETMIACKGVGLAAPQVHHSIRLFVMRTPIENGEGGYDLGPIKVFINPKLSQPSKETWKVSEGCLSIPTIRADVERPKEISVEYTSLDGNIVQERVSGWQARVIMHENDHINGVLFVDRLNEQEKIKLAPLLKNLEKRIHDDRAL
jgi:peptide deformylase